MPPPVCTIPLFIFLNYIRTKQKYFELYTRTLNDVQVDIEWMRRFAAEAEAETTTSTRRGGAGRRAFVRAPIPKNT